MKPSRAQPSSPRHGVARVLSKLGYCSRSQGRVLVFERRVRVNGVPCTDPEQPVDPARDQLEVDGRPVRTERRLYLMLNKPRGIVTTRADEQGRQTVYDCLRAEVLPWVAPVGRLDRASEGLLLLTNDTAWGDRLMDPACHVDKTYHVQVDCIPDADFGRRLQNGLTAADGEFLRAGRAHLLRAGPRNSWLEIVIDEGKNRQIRRLLEACGIQVLRLVRVAIGSLQLGALPKGQFRHLTPAEVEFLSRPGGPGRTGQAARA